MTQSIIPTNPGEVRGQPGIQEFQTRSDTVFAG
jgi:hypothetical protein